jgi:GNAT superfamily N-acetyltransferase
LFSVFRSVREQELASLALPEEQKVQLLRQQFVAQRGQYYRHYPDADFDVVLLRDVPIGNMYAARGPDDFALVDISLLPERRNGGVGAHLVSELIKQAHAAGKPVHAHVRRGNPAWRLWQRLGFEQTGDDGVYLEICAPSHNVGSPGHS